jgi:hypothetical protein
MSRSNRLREPVPGRRFENHASGAPMIDPVSRRHEDRFHPVSGSQNAPDNLPSIPEGRPIALPDARVSGGSHEARFRTPHGRDPPDDAEMARETEPAPPGRKDTRERTGNPPRPPPSPSRPARVRASGRRPPRRRASRTPSRRRHHSRRSGESDLETAGFEPAAGEPPGGLALRERSWATCFPSSRTRSRQPSRRAVLHRNAASDAFRSTANRRCRGPAPDRQAKKKNPPRRSKRGSEQEFMISVLIEDFEDRILRSSSGGYPR